MADAKAIVMIFTFELRCLGKINLLRTRLVTQTCVTLKAATHHKIQRFVHANVMEYPATKKELLLINRSASALRRNEDSGASAFLKGKLAMRWTLMARWSKINSHSFE